MGNTERWVVAAWETYDRVVREATGRGPSQGTEDGVDGKVFGETRCDWTEERMYVCVCVCEGRQEVG